MKKDISEKWIAALESGQYEQGLCTLRSKDDKFCCLGVLCDLYDQTHKEGNWDKSLNLTYQFLGQGEILPEKVKMWAGMNTETGELPDSTVPTSLMELNDNGFDFSKIAKKIKKHWKEL